MRDVVREIIYVAPLQAIIVSLGSVGVSPMTSAECFLIRADLIYAREPEKVRRLGFFFHHLLPR